jgi:hypothetical protein
MDQADSEVNEVIDAGTGTNNPMFKCGKRSCTLTAFMLPNFGKMFYTCVNYVERIFFFFFFFCIFSRNPALDLILGYFDWVMYGMVYSSVFAEICLL